MARTIVVGSGAAGVHFAQTALELGHEVLLLDVGFEGSPLPEPDSSFTALKDRLPRSEEYFLGPHGEAVVYPSPAAKPFGFPPSKEFVFRSPPAAGTLQRRFDAYMSHAKGGLAEVWTGGSYELGADELRAMHFDPAEFSSCYQTVARRIGITGADDDIRAFSPLTASYLEPLPMDEHSALLYAQYERRRGDLNRAGFFLGRSRVAVLTQDLGDRRACAELGRCFWGCPRGSLYTPSLSFPALRAHPRFAYRRGCFVKRVLLDRGDRAVGVVASDMDGRGEEEVRAEIVVLAAGTLATSRIYLETLAARGTPSPELPGLMDNRQVMMPFLNLRRLGADVRLDSYQYHMLALAIRTVDWRDNVHGQISTLKAAAVHPIIQQIPLDLRTSIRAFQRIRAGLAIANIWLSEHRRSQNVVRLARHGDGSTHFEIDYGDDGGDEENTRAVIKRTRRALRALGCIVPRRMTKVLARGSSGRYAGTIPTSDEDVSHTLRPNGSVRGMDRLYVADGAGFSWLPSKNMTFTLMANAVRIATGLS